MDSPTTHPAFHSVRGMMLHPCLSRGVPALLCAARRRSLSLPLPAISYTPPSNNLFLALKKMLGMLKTGGDQHIMLSAQRYCPLRASRSSRGFRWQRIPLAVASTRTVEVRRKHPHLGWFRRRGVHGLIASSKCSVCTVHIDPSPGDPKNVTSILSIRDS